MTNCTIIIPTYNRPACLRRILDYYSNYGKDFNIIVADSSSDEYKRLNKDIISSVSKLGIQYLDSYPTEINPYRKFADALNYVNTEYCVFCADDDFVTPNGIKQSVDFLEKNPDFIVALGRQISFRLENGKGKKLKFRWNFADAPISIEFPDPESRVEYHLSNYFASTIYGVHRSDALKMIFDEVLKFEVDLFLFGELLTSMLTLVYGKMKCLDVLYSVRSQQTKAIGLPSLRDAIDAGTFDAKYAKFRDCLAMHLSKKSRLGIEESGKLVDKAMSEYVRKYARKRIRPIRKSKKRALLDSLHLPRWMYNGIIASYEILYEVREPKLLYNALLVKPVFSLLKHRDDFNRIRLYVLSSSETIYDEIAKSSIIS